jgi:diguanylate cyclase (GGDEF)-like protein
MPQRRRGALGALVVGLGLVGVLAGVLANRLTPAAPVVELPTPLVAAILIALFALCERFELHVETRKDAFTLSFSELAFVLAVFLVNPIVLIAASTLGRLTATLWDHVRRSPVKLAFNTVLFGSTTALGLVVFALVGGGGSVGHPRTWLAVVVTTATMMVIDATAVWSAVAVTTGTHLPLWSTLPIMVIGGLAIPCLGLAMVLLLDSTPLALVLLVPPVGLLFWMSKSYLRLAERHEVLERLQRIGSQVTAADTVEASIATALRDAAEITRAEDTEIVLLGSDDRPAQRVRLNGTDGALESTGTGERTDLDPAVSAILSGTTDRVATDETVAVPIEIGGRRLGVIVARHRQGDVAGFEGTDATVLGTIATHAASAIENARLIDRLRIESAQRQELAHRDPLTGIPNRRGFTHDLQAFFERLRRTQRPFAFVMIDLARFKDVNDTFGHVAGDLVVRTIAERLDAMLRPTDRCARLGGDEFAVLLDGASATDAHEFARRALHQIERPILYDGVPVVVSAALGIATAPQHGTDERTLTHHADVALYSAKESRDAVPVVVFDDDKERATTRRHRLALDLRHALERPGELELFYQPKAKLSQGNVSSVEALLRWRHPELGFVPPDEFVRIAETTGLINRLTASVLEMGIAQAGQWQHDGIELGMSLNVSVANLLDEHLPDRVNSLLHRHVVDPASITLEVTETELMRDPSRTAEVLNRLDSLGVRLSIDDFGTGYSSLAYLKRIPVRELKIDKVFVTDLVNSRNDLVIARSVIGLADNLDIACVAEGVEDEATWDLLRSLGCNEAQGYFLARPMPADDLAAFLSTHHA